MKLDLGLIFGLIFLVLLIVVVSFGFWFIYQNFIDDEKIVVTGEIVSVEYIENDYVYGDILNLTFDSGDWYHLYVREDFDFTVHSKFIISMHRDNRWAEWTIIRIFKVP